MPEDLEDDEEEPNGKGYFATLWCAIRRNPEPLAGFGIGFIILGFLQLIVGKDLIVMPLYLLDTTFSIWLVVIGEHGCRTPPPGQHRRRIPPPERPSHRIF